VQNKLLIVLFTSMLFLLSISSVHLALAQESEGIRIFGVGITDFMDVNRTMVLSFLLASEEPIRSVTLSYQNANNSWVNASMVRSDTNENSWEEDAAMKQTLKSYTQQNTWEAVISPKVYEEKKQDATSVQQSSRIATAMELYVALQSKAIELSIPQDYFPMAASIRSTTTPLGLFQGRMLLVGVVLTIAAVPLIIVGIKRAKKLNAHKRQ